MFGLATEIVDTDGLWHIIQQAGTPLLFVVGVALGVGFGYWLVARGPMGKALQTAGAALEENARAFTTLMRTITDQNEQIIALQNSVDEALDAKRAMRKELDDAKKRMALRDAEHVTELERVRCEFAARVAELEKAVAAGTSASATWNASWRRRMRALTNCWRALTSLRRRTTRNWRRR